MLVALPLTGLAARNDENVVARAPSAAQTAASEPSVKPRRTVASGPSVASAEATGQGARGFSAQVDSSPNQRVIGNWSAVCLIGSDRGRLSGRFTGKTPLDVAIPLTVSASAKCTIKATARGTNGGVNIEIRSK